MLRRLGRTVEMVRYPEESTSCSRSAVPTGASTALERIVDWFERYL